MLKAQTIRMISFLRKELTTLELALMDVSSEDDASGRSLVENMMFRGDVFITGLEQECQNHRQNGSALIGRDNVKSQRPTLLGLGARKTAAKPAA